MSTFDWKVGKEYREIRYELCDGVAKISINRPHRRNAFTPLTVMEMYDAFNLARDDASVGVILLTEKFGREFPDLIDEIKLERTMPLLIEIPDRHGTGRKKDFITSYVTEAIGLKL